jgi:hypothetical protein
VPTYKNRMPMDPKETIWHYTSLDAVVAILRNRQLRLTRVDAFGDPFEGSVPKQQIDDQVPIFSSAHEMMMESVAAHYPGMEVRRIRHRDPWQEMTDRRRAMTRSAHANCWSSGHESEALWRLYCHDNDYDSGSDQSKGVGLALRSHLAKLEASVADADVYVSPVKYRFYHEGPAFDDELDAFMHKRQGFECEREVRVLKFDKAHYYALSNSLIGNAEASSPDELPTYRFLDWSLTSAIDWITVSPYASEVYESKARDAIVAVDPKLVVESSVLSERLYKANF